MDEKISLVILEAYERDVGKGIARAGSDIMKIIDASSGDIIELAGHRKTAVKLLQIYPSDEKMGMIRIDGLIRNNVGANIGDKITIRKISHQRAEKVTVFALESIPPMDERYLADALHTFPVTKGDNIMVPYFGAHLTFQISNTKPDSVVVIDKKTIFDIENKNSGFVRMESVFAHPNDFPNSEKLAMLKATIEQYEKELLKKQEEVKTISRNMLSENHDVNDIQKLLNENMNNILINIYEQLLNAYRQYVTELETVRK